MAPEGRAAGAGEIEHAVVAWDDAAVARHAAEWAVRRLGGTGRIRLLRVAPEWRDGATGASELAADVTMLRRLHPTMDITGALEHGDPEVVLRRAATPHTMLVIGVAAGDGADRGVAVRVAARAAGPVVIVPDPLPHPGDRVVAGVDGSEASIAAALVAAAEAVRLGQPLVVVHAWWETIGWDAMLPFEAHVIDSLEGAHRAVLDECAGVVARRFPVLEITRLLVHAPAGEALAGASGYASLVVLGRHSGVAIPALLGASARALLRRTAVPTMVVGVDRAPVAEEEPVEDPAPAHA
ncbi:universal stress protein [Amnibacterium sp.]|uniref:universal stress protein n=1 Tax=Amnibacterium sp. TaxID=1872496 RepID=UPI003F7BC9BB